MSSAQNLLYQFPQNLLWMNLTDSKGNRPIGKKLFLIIEINQSGNGEYIGYFDAIIYLTSVKINAYVKHFSEVANHFPQSFCIPRTVNRSLLIHENPITYNTQLSTPIKDFEIMTCNQITIYPTITGYNFDLYNKTKNPIQENLLEGMINFTRLAVKQLRDVHFPESRTLRRPIQVPPERPPA